GLPVEPAAPTHASAAPATSQRPDRFVSNFRAFTSVNARVLLIEAVGCRSGGFAEAVELTPAGQLGQPVRLQVAHPARAHVQLARHLVERLGPSGADAVPPADHRLLGLGQLGDGPADALLLEAEVNVVLEGAVLRR